MKNYTQGDRVYNRSGHEGEYVGKIENGPYLVRPVLECYEGDEAYTELGHLQEWEEIFDRAPVEKVDAQLVQKKQELQEITDALAEARREKIVFEAQAKERMERIKQHEGLELLDDILAKKFTHYIVVDWCDAPEIVDVKTTLSGDSDRNYEKKLKLLSLHGNVRSGEIRWTLNHYSDGSGSASSALIFMSYDQALAGMGKLIEQKWEKFWNSASRNGDGHRNTGGLDNYVKAAEKYGFPVPIEIREEIRLSKLRNAEYNLGKAKENLAEWQATYDSVKDPIVQP